MSDYKIIEGIPEYVEIAVQRLIDQGFSLNGSLLSRDVDNNSIVIQGMVKNKDIKNNIYAFKLKITKQFDFSSLINLISGRSMRNQDVREFGRYNFCYILKMKAPSAKVAEESITNEIDINFSGISVSWDLEFLKEEEIYI